MRVILKMIVPAAALVFALACGDDDDGTPSDDNPPAEGGSGNENPTAGTGGTGGTPAPTGECKGVYAAWKEEQVTSEASEGACQDDTVQVCARDLNTEAGAAGQACYGLYPEDPQALAGCILDLLKMGQETNPSDACLGCYIASVGCVQENCLAACLGAPSSAECIECRAENGCTSAFYECSGLPDPTNVPEN